MLKKCANPICLEEFRSLRRGRLFVMDTPAAPPKDNTLGVAPRRPRRLEYFWLCDSCHKTMTVAVDRYHQIVVSAR